MVIQNFLFRKHLDDGEEIVAVAHKHLWVVLSKLIRDIFFGLVIPLGIYVLFPLTLAYMVIWGFLGFLVFLYDFYDWYFDAWLMTNQGLLDVEWKGLFDKTSTRIEYHMIEGVAYEIKGFWPTILNFGVLTLEKVGSGVLVQLQHVNNPKRVEQQVLACQKKYLKQKTFREHGALKDLLTEMIIGHVRDNGLPDFMQKEIDEQ